MTRDQQVRVGRLLGFLASLAAVGAVAAIDGCSSGSGGLVTVDGGVKPGKDAGPSCTPNAKECVSSALARICPSDGSGWLALPCGTGQSCTGAGVCASDGGTSCTPNAQQCIDSKIAEVCASNGASWLTVACTADETCSNGACVGAVDAGCPAGMSECVNATLARVCPADGSGWLALECQAGQVCSQGACVFTADAACTPGAGSCTSATAGLQCNAQGTGYVAVTCPTNTTCSGAGVCTGAVAVGSGNCPSTTTISTSTDGFTFTTASCPTGKYCVLTTPTTAACLTGNCIPDPYNCDLVCGNKVTASANQTEYYSTCTMTPSGYEWTATQCASPTTCSPQTGSPCGPNFVPQPTCSGMCAPGMTRCAPDGSGVQTCSTDGTTWGASVACNAAAGLVCGGGFCGNPVCFEAGAFSNPPGTCTTTGLFQGCTSSYTLVPIANATACPAGTTCEQAGTIPGAYQPGQCQQQCTPGATQCAGGGLETCTTGGEWGGAVTCATGTTCNQNNTGVAACGVCAPGTHRCTTSTGDAGAGDAGVGDIETCSSTGTWSAPVACSVGTCQQSQGDYACLADCIPGATVCGGTNGIQTATCTASGTVPAFASCPTGESCRLDSQNNAIGCIQCLGPNHGFPADQECTTTTAGQPGTAAIDTCGANDTWAAPMACSGTTTCSLVGGQSCETFLHFRGAGPCGAVSSSALVTESSLAACFGGGGDLCQDFGLGVGEVCGSTPNCCTQACQGAPAVLICQ